MPAVAIVEAKKEAVLQWSAVVVAVVMVGEWEVMVGEQEVMVDMVVEVMVG
jgi:hypothetical protein